MCQPMSRHLLAPLKAALTFHPELQSPQPSHSCAHGGGPRLPRETPCPGAAALAGDLPAALPQPSVTSVSKLLSIPSLSGTHSLGSTSTFQQRSEHFCRCQPTKTAQRGSSRNLQCSPLRGMQRRGPPSLSRAPEIPGAASHAWPAPFGRTSVCSAGSQHFPEHP